MCNILYFYKTNCQFLRFFFHFEKTFFNKFSYGFLDLVSDYKSRLNVISILVYFQQVVFSYVQEIVSFAHSSWFHNSLVLFFPGAVHLPAATILHMYWVQVNFHLLSLLWLPVSPSVFQKPCTAPTAVTWSPRRWTRPSGGAPRRTCWEPRRVTRISLLHFMIL